MNKNLREVLIQLSVAFLSVGALAASYSTDPAIRAWSPYLGLCSQPLWFYLSIRSKLWGPFAVSVSYTLVYIYGLFNT